MKHWRWLWLVLACPVAYAAACPTGQPKDESALVQVEQNWARALEDRDAAALGCILAYEFQDADPDGKLFGRTQTLSKAAQHRPIHHELAEMRAQVYGDVAYIRGLATALDPQTKLTTKVRFTDIYVYRAGRWQCVAGHESLVSAMSH